MNWILTYSLWVTIHDLKKITVVQWFSDFFFFFLVLGSPILLKLLKT